jgi:hypothetical protein
VFKLFLGDSKGQDMGISELRQAAFADEGLDGAFDTLGTELVQQGVISSTDMSLAGVVRQHCDASLDRVLMAENLATQDDLLEAHARRLNSRRLSQADLEGLPQRGPHADPRELIKHGALPVTDRDGNKAVVTGQPERILSDPQQSAGHIAEQPRILVADPKHLQTEIANRHRQALTDLAQSRVPKIESCRTWGARRTRRLAISLGLLVVLSLVTWRFPNLILGGGRGLGRFHSHGVGGYEDRIFRGPYGGGRRGIA